MKNFLLFLMMALVNPLLAQETFVLENIKRYLIPSNPFFYTAVGKENIYKERDKYYLGDLDSKLFLKYDKKDYSISEAEFLDTGVNQALENGMELTVAYRKAEGTQEYSNIKTGNEGEVRAGVKIPVVSFVKGMNQRKLNIDSARLDKVKFKHESNNNLRKLYFHIASEYFQVLYFQSIVELQEELLLKAQVRKGHIQERVNAGTLAKLAYLEAKQQTINRTQNVLSAKNDYSMAFESFLKYLNISKNEFEQEYSFSSLAEVRHSEIALEDYIQMAIANRPDLKAYASEIQKVQLEQKQTTLLAYPKMDLSLQGVHDFQYENGFKVSLDIAFPVQRRKFDGKNIENKNSIRNLQMNKEKEILNIKTKLLNIVSSLAVLRDNLESSHEELELLEKLEEAEEKRYLVGLSNLFMLNMREMATLNVKKKVMRYHFKSLLLEQEASREAGVSL